MVCAFLYKQNLGHIGTRLVVMGVHGHCRTMKREQVHVLYTFWDTLAAQILEFGVHILTGDSNMYFTQVTIELRTRGVLVTCAAWTPWWMEDAAGFPGICRQ